MTIYHTGFAVDAVVNAQIESFAPFITFRIVYYCYWIILLQNLYNLVLRDNDNGDVTHSFPSTRDTVETIFPTGLTASLKTVCSVRFFVFIICYYCLLVFETLFITFLNYFFTDLLVSPPGNRP